VQRWADNVTGTESNMLSFCGRIIDAWMQHPTPRLRGEPMFDSLRRWVPGTDVGHSDSGRMASDE
jgi:hypothetical protein